MDGSVPRGPDVEVVRAAAEELATVAAGLPCLAGVRAGTRDHVIATLAAMLADRREGPVAAVRAPDGVPRVLSLASFAAEGWSLRSGLPGHDVGRGVLTALSRGVDGLVAHALRSPLVRAQGAATLLERAWRRDRIDELEAGWQRLTEVIDVALARADAHLVAIRRLAAGGSPTARTDGPELERLIDPADLEARIAATDGPEEGRLAEHDHLAVGGPVEAVVLVSQLDAVPVAALRRLVAYLRAARPVVGLRVLIPGGDRHREAMPWPVAGKGPRPVRGDQAADLAAARAWIECSGQGTLDALADLVVLRRTGTSVLLLPSAASSRQTLAAAADGSGGGAAGWARLAVTAPHVVELAGSAPGWSALLADGFEAVLLDRP